MKKGHIWSFLREKTTNLGIDVRIHLNKSIKYYTLLCSTKNISPEQKSLGIFFIFPKLEISRFSKIMKNHNFGAFSVPGIFHTHHFKTLILAGNIDPLLVYSNLL